MITASLLVWQGWALAGWIQRFRIGPDTLLSAWGQYYTAARWSAAALVGNWVAFSGAFAALAGVAVIADAAGRTALRLAGLRLRVPGLALATGFGLIASAVLGAGLTGLLVAPPRLPVLCLLGAIGAAGIIRRRGALLEMVADLHGRMPWPSGFVRARSGAGGWVRDRLDALVAGPVSAPVRVLVMLGLVVAAFGVLNVEMAWDALTYHLRLPSFYLQRHKIYNVWHHDWSTFPSQIEMLYLLGKLVEGDLLARMLNALLGLLVLPAALGLARACGVGGALALPLIAASPVWLLLLDRAYIDPGFALFLTLSLRLLLVRLATGSGAALVVSAACAGFGLSCKYVGVLFLPAVAAAAWPLLGSARGRRDAVRWATVAFLPLGAWLARNGLDRGNPVSPMLGGLFGTHELLPGDVTPIFQRPDPWAELLRTAPERCLAMLENGGRIDGPLVAAVMGLFPLLLLRAPATTAGRALRRATLAYVAGWWLLANDSRFFLPALPWVAILIEEGWLAWRSGASRAGRVAGRVLLEGALAAGVLYGTSIRWTFFAPFAMPLGFDTPVIRHQQSLPPAPYTFYMKEYINAATPPQSRVWFLANFCTYYVERECIADFHFGTSRFTRFARTRPTAEAMAKGFRQLGFRYLLSTGHEATQYLHLPGYFDLPDATWVEFRRLLATRAQVEWQSETYVLFRLDATWHAPRPLPAFPLLEAIAFERADRDLAEGRYPDALRAFLNPPPLLAEVGSTFVRQGDGWMVHDDMVRAETAFRRALAAGTDNPRVRAGIAQARLRLGDPGGALPHAEEAFRQHPLSSFNAASLAQIYATLRRTDDARRLAATAVTLAPGDPQIRELARLLGVE